MTEETGLQILATINDLVQLNQYSTGLLSASIGVMVACAIGIILGVWLRDI